MFVSLHADRLAHRQRLAVMAPLFRARAAAAALLPRRHPFRPLAEGDDRELRRACSAVYPQPVFRENLAGAAVAAGGAAHAIWLNWRLGLLLVALWASSSASIAIFVKRRTETLQTPRGAFYNSGLSERASDALGNVQVMQSFTRVGSETAAMREPHGRPCSTRRCRSCRGGRWRWCARRAASTITLAADLRPRHDALPARARHDRRASSCS